MKLSLFYPLKPWYVTQKFGETAFLAYYEANGVKFTGHNGADAVANHGDAVRASHDGTVEVQVDSKQGHGVVITTNETFDYKDGQAYFRSIYWHLINNIPVKTGQKVKAGDIIGYADSTGLSTGNHLHFGLKPAYKDSKGFIRNLEPDNGTQGAIDPTPYFNSQYAEDINEFVFLKDMRREDENEDVKQLQKRLRKLGYFSFPTDTGYYGEVTRDAVYAFQLNHVKMGWMARYVYRGLYCYESTRKALNNVKVGDI